RLVVGLVAAAGPSAVVRLDAIAVSSLVSAQVASVLEDASAAWPAALVPTMGLFVVARDELSSLAQVVTVGSRAAELAQLVSRVHVIGHFTVGFELLVTLLFGTLE